MRNSVLKPPVVATCVYFGAFPIEPAIKIVTIELAMFDAPAFLTVDVFMLLAPVATLPVAHELSLRDGV